MPEGRWMSRRGWSAGLAAAVAGLAMLGGRHAAAQQGPAGPEELVRQFTVAMAERNADKLAALHAERAVLMMPEGPVAAGRDQIRAIYARNFATADMRMTLAQARVDGGEDSAVVLWVWNVEIGPPGRDPLRRRVRSMVHVKKTPGGWQIFADMYQVLPAG